MNVCKAILVEQALIASTSSARINVYVQRVPLVIHCMHVNHLEYLIVKVLAAQFQKHVLAVSSAIVAHVLRKTPVAMIHSVHLKTLVSMLTVKLAASALTPVTQVSAVQMPIVQSQIISLNVSAMNHSLEMHMMLNVDAHSCHLNHFHAHLMIHVLMETFVDHLLMERKVVSMHVKMFNADQMLLVK